MATRTPSAKSKSTGTRATTRKTPARKAPAKKQDTAGKGGATTAVAGALRRNAFPLAGALAAGAAAAAAIFFTRRDADAPASGHPAPDLERDDHPGPDDRADPHFRPDMDAQMTAEDRAALAPALADGDGRPTMAAG